MKHSRVGYSTAGLLFTSEITVLLLNIKPSHPSIPTVYTYAESRFAPVAVKSISFKGSDVLTVLFSIIALYA